jgi:hypothetical protein
MNYMLPDKIMYAWKDVLKLQVSTAGQTWFLVGFQLKGKSWVFMLWQDTIRNGDVKRVRSEFETISYV